MYAMCVCVCVCVFVQLEWKNQRRETRNTKEKGDTWIKEQMGQTALVQGLVQGEEIPLVYVCISLPRAASTNTTDWTRGLKKRNFFPLILKARSPRSRSQQS